MFLKRFGVVLWWLFIVYGFVLFVEICDSFIHNSADNDPDWSWWGVSLLLYFPALVIVIAICLFVSRRAIFAPLCVLALILSAFRFDSVPQYVFVAQFWISNYPETSYIKNHCHPMHFVQDGKRYAFGDCDVSVDPSPGSDGQTGLGEHIIYDTSGDIANDTYSYSNETPSQKQRRKVFVDAFRRYFNDDPNEAFEIADFQTTWIGGHFYSVVFNDTDVEGFLRDFGPPPTNPKNPFLQCFND